MQGPTTWCGTLEQREPHCLTTHKRMVPEEMSAHGAGCNGGIAGVLRVPILCLSRRRKIEGRRCFGNGHGQGFSLVMQCGPL
jgi:hypothetical protein